MEGAFMDAKDMRSSDILLETGTNELELLEFDINGNLYGINIAKVREIMRPAELVPIPHSAPEIEGVFMPRDRLITAEQIFKLGQESYIEWFDSIKDRDDFADAYSYEAFKSYCEE